MDLYQRCVPSSRKAPAGSSAAAAAASGHCAWLFFINSWVNTRGQTSPLYERAARARDRWSCHFGTHSRRTASLFCKATTYSLSIAETAQSMLQMMCRGCGEKVKMAIKKPPGRSPSGRCCSRLRSSDLSLRGWLRRLRRQGSRNTVCRLP